MTAIEESLHEAINADHRPETLVKTQGETPGKTPDRILSLLREAPALSITQLASSLGKSDSAIERAIRKLREAGRLKRVGADKGGHWQVLDNDHPNNP